MSDKSPHYGDLANTVGYLLRSCYRLSRNEVMKVLEENGLKEIELTTLIAVKNNPGCSLSDIAKVASVDLPVAHRHAQRLEKIGYIEGRKSQNDRRVTIYRITQRGTEVEARVKELSQKADKFLYKDISEQDMANLLQTLQKISGIRDI